MFVHFSGCRLPYKVLRHKTGRLGRHNVLQASDHTKDNLSQTESFSGQESEVCWSWSEERLQSYKHPGML